MKKNINILFYLSIALGIGFSGCGHAPDKIEMTTSDTTRLVPSERYETHWQEGSSDEDVEVIEIRGCIYIFWHNGYGSDFEHHEGCLNAHSDVERENRRLSKMTEEELEMELNK